MITIKDIAAEAGVSKSTVSRVLTQTGYVREDTKNRILKVMKERGFQPSASARSLSSQTTNTIGVVVPEIWNPFYAEVLQGVSEVVDEQNMTMIYCNTDDNAAKEEKALRMLEGQRVCGMILAPSVEYSDKEAVEHLKPLLEKLNAPVVLVDRDVPNMHLDSVMYDNYGAAYASTEALLRAGNRRVGMITGDMGLKIARDRYDGFMDAMKDARVEVKPQDVLYGDFTSKKAYELSCAMYDSGDYPDGILTSNNMTTLGFLRATGDRNFRLGREIAMIGLDHIAALDTIDYMYSYVTRDTVAIGRKTMELLLGRIKQPDMPQTSVTFPYQLVLKGAEKKSG